MIGCALQYVGGRNSTGGEGYGRERATRGANIAATVSASISTEIAGAEGSGAASGTGSPVRADSIICCQVSQINGCSYRVGKPCATIVNGFKGFSMSCIVAAIASKAIPQTDFFASVVQFDVTPTGNAN